LSVCENVLNSLQELPRETSREQRYCQQAHSISPEGKALEQARTCSSGYLGLELSEVSRISGD